MQKLSNPSRHLEQIAIGQIIFDHTEWVSLWGYTSADQQNKMDFIINFETLNKLLRLSGEKGDQIQMLVVERIEKGIEEPSIIDLEEKFNGPLLFDQCRLDVSATWIKSKTGEWNEDHSCLSIDDISPLLEKKKPVLSTQSLLRRNFSECVEILVSSYKLYLGYLEIDQDEEAALQMAGLEDDLKFKMAYYAWKMDPLSK